MRHRNATYIFSRTAAPRRALYRALLTSMAVHGRIRTTEAKAKALRPRIERLVTLARHGTLTSRRRLRRTLTTDAAVEHLLSTVAPRMRERRGGYTRIVRLGPRTGDGAPMALLTFVE